jgi:hypothetical protein
MKAAIALVIKTVGHMPSKYADVGRSASRQKNVIAKPPLTIPYTIEAAIGFQIS